MFFLEQHVNPECSRSFGLYFTFSKPFVLLYFANPFGWEVRRYARHIRLAIETPHGINGFRGLCRCLKCVMQLEKIRAMLLDCFAYTDLSMNKVSIHPIQLQNALLSYKNLLSDTLSLSLASLWKRQDPASLLLHLAEDPHWILSFRIELLVLHFGLACPMRGRELHMAEQRLGC